jgi:hypothetical protein
MILGCERTGRSSHPFRYALIQRNTAMKLIHISNPKKPNSTYAPALVQDADREKELRARLAEQGLIATVGIEVLK